MKYLKRFESYTFEDFTNADMEDVKELLDEGLTAEEIAIELDFSLEKVEQIIYSLENNSDDEDTYQGCGCCPDCTGEEDCDCCPDCECSIDQGEEFDENLSIELENKLRTLSDDSKLTVDDFLEEFGVNPENMTGFGWASILNGAQKYKEMSDEEFFKLYDEYKNSLNKS